jgi:hypothetical protein
VPPNLNSRENTDVLPQPRFVPDGSPLRFGNSLVHDRQLKVLVSMAMIRNVDVSSEQNVTAQYNIGGS